MRKKQVGFTLMELLVTVIIIILLTAMALPTLTKFSENIGLRSASSRVATLMRQARQYAVNYNSIYRVDVHPGENWVAIYTGNTGGNLVGKVYHPASPVKIATTTINGSGAVNLKANGSVKFSPKGSADPACYIHLVKSNSLFQNVKDSFGAPVSGGVTYYQDNYDFRGVSDDEKSQCYTIAVNANLGRVKLYKVGKGEPWE